MCVLCQFKVNLLAQVTGVCPMIEPGFAAQVVGTDPVEFDAAISQQLFDNVASGKTRPAFPVRLKTHRLQLIGAFTGLVSMVRLLRNKHPFDGLHDDFRRICGPALDELRCKDWQEEFNIHIAKMKIEFAKEDHDECRTEGF